MRISKMAPIMIAAVLLPARATAQGASAAREAAAAPMMSKPLPDVPGKEVVMFEVTYPPGHSGAVHRHNADTFAFILEGSVEEGLNDGKPITLGPGQTFYEGPKDIHTIGRNTSKTRPAKFLVFMIKDKDAPISVPVK